MIKNVWDLTAIYSFAGRESLLKVRHFPREMSPCQGSHAMRIASSAHRPIQCCSLPHASGAIRTATLPCISRHAGPQAFAQSAQPVHLSSSMTGIHL